MFAEARIYAAPDPEPDARSGQQPAVASFLIISHLLLLGAGASACLDSTLPFFARMCSPYTWAHCLKKQENRELYSGPSLRFLIL